ncbi:hypothetical protein D3C76_1348060 [compost metagenome]
MLSMVVMIAVMSLPELSISAMAAISSLINLSLSPASAREAWDCSSAFLALAALSRVWAAICVITALISVMDEAELEAPSESD